MRKKNVGAAVIMTLVIGGCSKGSKYKASLFDKADKYEFVYHLMQNNGSQADVSKALAEAESIRPPEDDNPHTKEIIELNFSVVELGMKVSNAKLCYGVDWQRKNYDDFMNEALAQINSIHRLR